VNRAAFDLEYRASVAACSNPYGDGCSSARIADLLAEIPFDDKLLIKDITY
jgi:GDP/UDP-N,N'-diacetylbacillosamine 2-epimerase (hydrolysing)